MTVSLNTYYVLPPPPHPSAFFFNSKPVSCVLMDGAAANAVPDAQLFIEYVKAREKIIKLRQQLHKTPYGPQLNSDIVADAKGIKSGKIQKKRKVSDTKSDKKKKKKTKKARAADD